VWLEGDNKHDSHDSRYYGPVPSSLLQGRVVMRVRAPLVYDVRRLVLWSHVWRCLQIWPLNKLTRMEKQFASQAFREPSTS
jgi:hypothetical protein